MQDENITMKQSTVRIVELSKREMCYNQKKVSDQE